MNLRSRANVETTGVGRLFIFPSILFLIMLPALLFCSGKSGKSGLLCVTHLLNENPPAVYLILILLRTPTSSLVLLVNPPSLVEGFFVVPLKILPCFPAVVPFQPSSTFKSLRTRWTLLNRVCFYMTSARVDVIVYSHRKSREFKFIINYNLHREKYPFGLPLAVLDFASVVP